MIIIAKMLGLTLLYVIFTIFIWYMTHDKRLKPSSITIIGVLYGIGSVLSTHFGVDYHEMMLNVRDIGPLAAGFFFHPVSGIIAGLIGGIERYIAGTYFGVGSYTRIACSVSTCLAGFLPLIMNKYVFKGQKPNTVYAFFVGATTEVFHMYVVFITHREDMQMAFHVVSNCAVPMIVFTAIGMALSASALSILEGTWHNPLVRKKPEEIPIASTFQKTLFVVMFLVIGINFAISYVLQTKTAYQYAKTEIDDIIVDIEDRYNRNVLLEKVRVGVNGIFDIYDDEGYIYKGNNKWHTLDKNVVEFLKSKEQSGFFTFKVFGGNSLCKIKRLNDGNKLIVIMPEKDIYRYRDAQAYENALSNILLFTVVFFLVSFIAKMIVVDKIDRINTSLAKITEGDLNEVVNVRSSTEFASLSDDINDTVEALKGYISATEKRIAQELEFASSIQMAALPRNFNFPGRCEFEIYALMDAAKEVGGDFYDFFFVDESRFVLVIADVSGKGVPAALFMMRSKTAIRNFAEQKFSSTEILNKVNDFLCEGNDAEMFVTAWVGIIDLKNGEMVCANAGHEFPILLRENGEYEVLRDDHSLPLAAIEGMQTKEYYLKLNPGDRIFVYTDGVPEAINDKKEQYGIVRLVNVLNENKNVAFKELLPMIRQDVADFANGEEQFDDITMLGFIFNDYLKVGNV
ncbi:MAG: SpoIIE family protein phosphatase [Lachnospiraceae bacterium]|nr:SpoIIE family protein phosphatase [Lachnospiraceae bacterium]